MEVEFLTQPNWRLGDHLDQALATHGTPVQLVIVSAFASLAALLRLKATVIQISKAGAKVQLVLGVDLGGTSKEALQEVGSWPIPVFVYKNRMIGITFHPKIYSITWPSRGEIIVGSNNLTDGGFYRNYEASSRTIYSLPADQVAFEKARVQLRRFLEPCGPVVSLLTPEYLAGLLALPEIPSEGKARRARAEGIPRHPPSNMFGFEQIPSAPKVPKVQVPPATPPSLATASPAAKPKAKGAPTKGETFAIQIRPHDNGEIFLSVTAALQNPEFFNWPFNGKSTPKKAGNHPYPQLVPDPIVDIVVIGASAKPKLTLSDYALNTLYYARNHEIRITASSLPKIVPDKSIMVMRRSEAPGKDYEILVHRPDSPDYQKWLDACDQKMPGGGKEPRRFGWL